MRWFSRADFTALIFAALLEGSLVGVAYLSIAMIGRDSAPLWLAHFWLAAAAGLLAARLSPGRPWLPISVPLAVVLTGLLGWLADPAVRDAFAHLADPLGAPAIHPVGWLLGIAALRGAMHVDIQRETDISTQAITYAFPILTIALLIHLGSGGGTFAVPAFAGSAVCVVAGLLSIGHARLRDLEESGTVTRGSAAWSVVSSGVVAFSIVAIAAALVFGGSAQEAVVSAACSVAQAGRSALALLGDGVAAVLSWLLQVVPASPMSTSTPRAGRVQSLPVSHRADISPIGTIPWLVPVVRLLILVLVVLAVVAIAGIVARRRAIPEDQGRPEERSREPFIPRLRLRLHLPLARPGFMRRLSRRRRPTSAVEAYVGLLDEFAGMGELAREPDETPRSHARRAAGLGIPDLPMALLAADYQLAVYGQADISKTETDRAIGRWRRLRRAGRRLPRREGGARD
jgi:hypothetical protein